MKELYNPAAQISLSIQSDIEAYLKRGGKIKEEPLKPAPIRVPKQFSLNTSKKEFEEVQQRRKKDCTQVVEVKYCKASGLYHIYQGLFRLSKKGYYSEQTARMQAAKTQEKINLENRIRQR